MALHAVPDEPEEVQLVKVKRAGNHRTKKFVVIGHETIPTDRIHPNPKNPRPQFHFGADNPEIVAMGDSILVDGLHNPLKVYELMPEAPGNYRIVQGHRRHAAAELAGVEELDCTIIQRPANEREELEWLGSEDAHKRSWSESGLFQMRHAYDLAKQHNLPSPNHPDIQAKTGLSKRQLEVAEKIFQLEPEIQYLCYQYEEWKYEQLLAQGRRGRVKTVNADGVKVSEFPPEKAAAVWELFDALRTHFTQLTKGYSDLELQMIIAIKAGRTTSDDLRNLISAVKQSGKNPRPGLMTQISDLLTNEKRKIHDVVRTTKNTHIIKLTKAARAAQLLDTQLMALCNNVDQLGADIELLKEADRILLRMLRHGTEFQMKLERVIKNEEKNL